MDRESIRKLLEDIKSGSITPDEAFERLKDLPFKVMEELTLDTARSLRCSFCEVILGEGKTSEQLCMGIKQISEHNPNVLVTRLDPKTALEISRKFPDFQYDEISRCFFRIKDVTVRGRRDVLVVTAGTSDIPVAKEAVVTMKVMGVWGIKEVFDVGVAGIHRLSLIKEYLPVVGVIIAIAGMDGALPSVIGGLCDKPVIAVPTSAGYGNFKGLSALLSALASCAPNVVTVGIDDGFGAGHVAALISMMK